MALAQRAISSAQGFVAPCCLAGITQAPAVQRVHLHAGRRKLELSVSWRGQEEAQRRVVQCRATVHRVEMIHEGKSFILEVPEDQTILEVALDNGVEVPHDCKLGVCMTCPSKVETGEVDQSEGMLSDDVIERGYALMRPWGKPVTRSVKALNFSSGDQILSQAATSLPGIRNFHLNSYVDG
ncbi:hypothetical protein R1sor_017116 [Riccia sorocarpa]|uniref:2Fe-2S ferredoxin-type domain-containing protein n=1 Tax=Riccia sorocarpa TaxID=122646 RepID=A0ABD3IC28_9MARC